VDPEGLVGARGGEGILLLPTGRGVWGGGYAFFPEKKNFPLEMALLVHSERYCFVRVLVS